jgi:hypothetical protein
MAGDRCFKSKNGSLMTQKRKVVRRKSDKLLRAISRKYGDVPLEDEDFVQVLLLICQLSTRFGKRQEDRRLWLVFLRNLEKIIDYFRELWILGRMPRMVRLQKVRGNPSLPARAYVGWETKQPTISETYSVFLLSGKLLQTSNVKVVAKTRISTKNSTYSIEVLEEYTALSGFVESFINKAMNRTKPGNIIRLQKEETGNQLLKTIK